MLGESFHVLCCLIITNMLQALIPPLQGLELHILPLVSLPVFFVITLKPPVPSFSVSVSSFLLNSGALLRASWLVAVSPVLLLGLTSQQISGDRGLTSGP